MANGAQATSIDMGVVEDIQELRRTQPMHVPDRYVRDAGERPADMAAGAVPLFNVPVIDMAKLRSEAAEELESAENSELEKLGAACRQWGFFQVVNHGVEGWLTSRMEAAAREFFMLPLEEKEKYPMAPGTIQGYGHAFVFSEHQKLDWCNMLALGIHPPSLRKPNLWPLNPPHFSETLETYSGRIRKLCRETLTHIARTLRLPPDTFDMFGEAVQAVRFNYYPPCSRPDLVLGLSSHSDGSMLTVLQQDATFAGLQVLKDDAWVSVQPIPDAFVINVGDTLEVLTNGKYKSVEHRAVTSAVTDRLSVVTFYAPSYEVELGPLPQLLLDSDHSNHAEVSKYRRYNHGDYNRHYVTRKLDGKKNLKFAMLDEPPPAATSSCNM